MLGGLFLVLGLSILMGIASILAGGLPLSLKLSKDKIRLISAFGMGLLIGSSLIVVIPEGVDTVYEAQVKSPIAHQRRHVPNWLRHAGAASSSLNASPGPMGTGPELCSLDCLEKREPVPSPPPHAGDPGRPAVDSNHSFIGLSLILGFILMYLIDKLPQIASDHLAQPDTPHHISLSNLGAGLQRSLSIGSIENSGLLEPSQPTQPSMKNANSPSRRSFITTLGLVIHALADGIALGATSASGDVTLNLVVFIAIMVHKAPAAFGLTTTLLKQGLPKRRIRVHLLAFSAAAPVGAIATWFLSTILGGTMSNSNVSDQPDSRWWTGHLLLFSGGSFIYVAMHGLQEEDRSKNPVQPNSIDSDARAQTKSNNTLETAAAVGGMFLPLITQFGHHH